MEYLAALLMAAGAVFIGLSIKEQNKLYRWFHMAVLSAGAHGFMLAFMAGWSLLSDMHPLMRLAGALSAIPPILRFLIAYFDKSATK